LRYRNQIIERVCFLRFRTKKRANFGIKL
jgi:hypothetical protein